MNGLTLESAEEAFRRWRAQRSSRLECILSNFPGRQIFNQQQEHLNIGELNLLKMPWHTCH